MEYLAVTLDGNTDFETPAQTLSLLVTQVSLSIEIVLAVDNVSTTTPILC